MIFFLLPLLFNPFSMVASWLPAFYLSIWPLIIQTMGRETLLTHALVLILFILTCDIARQTMLKLIGIDLISLPAGIALLAILLTEKGFFCLTLIQPIFNALLIVVEPLFLMIEIYIFTDMLKSLNKWISSRANTRDDDSQDISSWEPPLSTGAIITRMVVVLITISSYIGVYYVIQESKTLLGVTGTSVPINFNHAIGALVTLQLIAFAATVYKEEGILSESALVSMLASIPIFIASWSYFHMIQTKNLTSSSTSWTLSSYLPSLSIFDPAPAPLVDENNRLLHGATLASGQPVDFAFLEDSLSKLDILDGPSGQVAKAFLHRLIMIINSILGLSLDKLAKYYFGPDFWYILSGRLVCLLWWSFHFESSSSEQDDVAIGGANGEQTEVGATWRRLREKYRRFSMSLPISKRALVKVLLVLAYAQMLVQQMDNKHHLREQAAYLRDSTDHLEHSQANLLTSASAGSCCGQTSEVSVEQTSNHQEDTTSSWFHCMWTSARLCSTSNPKQQVNSSRARQLLEIVKSFLGLLFNSLISVANSLYLRLVQPKWLYVACAAWLARWRSPIVQRLGQSILVQVYYIYSLLTNRDDHNNSLY